MATLTREGSVRVGRLLNMKIYLSDRLSDQSVIERRLALDARYGPPRVYQVPPGPL